MVNETLITFSLFNFKFKFQTENSSLIWFKNQTIQFTININIIRTIILFYQKLFK